MKNRTKTNKSFLKLRNIGTAFVLAASAITLPFTIPSVVEAFRTQEVVTPYDDASYSPRRLRECADDAAAAAKLNKQPPLCRPDLVMQPSYLPMEPR